MYSPVPLEDPTSQEKAYPPQTFNATPAQNPVYAAPPPSPQVIVNIPGYGYAAPGPQPTYVVVQGASYAPYDANPVIQAILSRHYVVDICGWIARAWELYKNAWLIYLFFSLSTIIFYALVMIPDVGFLINLVAWPLTYGFFISSSHAIRTGSRVQFVHCYNGFLYFFPLFLISLLMSVFVFLGLLLCIVPGIYLIVALHFTPCVFLEYHDSGVGLFDSFKVSLAVVNKNFFSIMLYLIVLLLFILSGLLLFGVGIFVTLPVGMLSVTFAFQDLFGLNPSKSVTSGCVCC